MPIHETKEDTDTFDTALKPTNKHFEIRQDFDNPEEQVPKSADDPNTPECSWRFK